MTLKEYFKDKIDWKYYNLLLYTATKFEDKFNSSVCINIQLCDEYSRTIFTPFQYTSKRGDGVWRIGHVTSELIEIYDKSKNIYFSVSVFEGVSKYSEKNLKLFLEEIRDKSLLKKASATKLKVKSNVNSPYTTKFV